MEWLNEHQIKCKYNLCHVNIDDNVAESCSCRGQERTFIFVELMTDEGV